MADDHDLLIEVATNVRNICKKVDKLEQRQIDQSKFCQQVQTEKQGKFVTSSMWKWIMGLVMSLIMGAYGYAFYVARDHHAHASDVKIHRTLDVVKAAKE